MNTSEGTVEIGIGKAGIVAICLAASSIEGFDIQVAGVVAPKLAPLLGLTPKQMGFFFASATFGMIVGAFLGGLIADRFGRRLGLVISLAVFGLFTYATAYSRSFEMLFPLRFLTGLGLGGALPSLVATASEAVSPRRRGVAVGIVYAGLPLGAALASAVAIGIKEWQQLFFIGAVLPFLLIPFVGRFLPSQVSIGARSSGNGDKSLRQIFGKETRVLTLLLWVGLFFYNLVLYLLINWQPILLMSKGFTGESASAVQTAFNLSGAAAGVLAGLAIDIFDRRFAVAASGAVLLCALVYFAIMPPYLPFAVIASTGLGAGIVASQSILHGLAPQIYPANVRGTGVGLAIGMGRWGSVTGPLLAGLLIASGKSTAEVLIGIVPIAFAGGLATFLLVVVLQRKAKSTDQYLNAMRGTGQAAV